MIIEDDYYKKNFNKFSTAVEQLSLNARTLRRLNEMGIKNVGDLIQVNEKYILRTPGLGRKSLNEIKEVLSAISLYLGMEIPDWPSPKDIHQKNDTDFIEQNFANLIRSLDEVGFSIRAMNCIKNMGLKIVANLVQTSENDFIRKKNFGRKTLREINNFLGNVGLSLGMQIDWPPENYEALKIRHKEKIEEMLPADKQSLLEKIKSVLKEREALVVNCTEMRGVIRKTALT